MHIQPYLFFEGRCDEALAFYREALDAEVKILMRYSDSPDPTMCMPGTGDKVMHCAFQVGDTQIFASDGKCEAPAQFRGFSLSIAVSTVEEAQRRFAALSDGGQVVMPLIKTFYSPCFGMIVDRFGVMWMVLTVE